MRRGSSDSQISWLKDSLVWSYNAIAWPPSDLQASSSHFGPRHVAHISSGMDARPVHTFFTVSRSISTSSILSTQSVPYSLSIHYQCTYNILHLNWHRIYLVCHLMKIYSFLPFLQRNIYRIVICSFSIELPPACPPLRVPNSRMWIYHNFNHRGLYPIPCR